MATNYPGAIDSLTNPSAGDALTSPSHSAQHANANDAIEAIETELGTNPKGSDATVAARLTAIEAGTNLATNSVGTTQIAANAVGSSELADNAVDTAAIADGAVTSAKIADGTIVAGDVAASTFAAFGTVGNLLTANQASAESGATTGWSSNNATFTASTDRAVDGTYSFKLVTTSDTTVWMGHDAGVGNYTPVTAGETYTATVDWYVPSTNTGTIGSAAGPIIYWYTAAGVYVSDTGGVLGAPPEDAWTTRKVTAVAPATAAYARLFPIYTSSSYLKANDVVYIDRVGLWKGASGRWAMPGVPIPGQSRIAVNNAVDLSGTGSPEGVVTAEPGSTWLQTDATTDVKGWIRWIKATGTGNTGWVAGPEADTGWRDVSASMTTAGTTKYPNGKVAVRRVGKQVEMVVYTGASSVDGAASTTIYVIPTGFKAKALWTYRSPTGAMINAANGTPATGVGLYVSAGESAAIGQTATAGVGSSVVGSMTWSTEEAWPTSLPGAAA